MAGPQGGGGGDDPYYIQQMHAFLAKQTVGYEAYFDVDAPDGSHKIDGGAFPNAAAAYKQLWKT